MRRRIDSVAQRLSGINFLSKVGAGVQIQFDSFVLEPVQSWQEAILMHDQDAASDAFTEARNSLTRQLGVNFKKEYRQWEDIVDVFSDSTEIVFARVSERVNSMPDLLEIPSAAQLVVDWIGWDLVHYCLEQAYSNLVEPGFYSGIANVYEAGHFPCSWNEVWPNGKVWAF